MKNKSAKVNQGTKFCLVLIVFLIIALVVVYYLGFIKDTDKNTNTIVANNTSTVVPASELVTLYYEPDNRLFYAYIEDGCLYYYNDVRSFTSSNSEAMQKYEDLCDIKKMKTFNLGAGVNPVPFLITEEGQVFCVDYYTDQGIDVEIYEGLKDYKIEDILSLSGETASVFEILLKDGTTTTVTVGEDS